MKLFKSLCIDAAIIAVLIAGTCFNIDGAANVYRAWAWFGVPLSILSLMVIVACMADRQKHGAWLERMKQSANQYPRWLRWVIRLVTIGILAWHGWFWTLAATVFTKFLLSVAREALNSEASAK